MNLITLNTKELMLLDQSIHTRILWIEKFLFQFEGEKEMEELIELYKKESKSLIALACRLADEA